MVTDNPKTPNERLEAFAPEHGESGVDVTLIRWMLSLTPSERLMFLEERISDILAVRALNEKA